MDKSKLQDVPGRVAVMYCPDSTSVPAVKKIQLPDPKTKTPRTYYLTTSHLLEATRYKQQHSSWFIDDEVVSDGALTMLTPVDPLLVMLPRLTEVRRKTSDHDGVFCELAQLLEHPDYPGYQQLSSLITPQLACICDIKQVDEDCYYRLNDNRVLAWLVCKARQMQAACRSHLPSSAMLDDDAGLGYAVGMVGEYLGQEWMLRVQKLLGLQDLQGTQGTHQQQQGGGGTQQVAAEQVDKRPKLDPKEAAKQKAAQSRAENKAAQLAKTAAGSKKISSFFVKR